MRWQMPAWQDKEWQQRVGVVQGIVDTVGSSI
jgi:hypothetical protein